MYANEDDAEIAACRIVMDYLTINLCCIYCPPNMSLESFKLSLKRLASVCLPSEACLEFGDFNIPSMNWSGDPDSNYPKPKEFLKFCMDNGCVQLIDFPTRGNAFLDLVLTNDPLIVSNVTVSAPFFTSDYDSILLSVISTSNKKCPSRDAVPLGGAIIPCHLPNYAQANWPAFSRYLSSINRNYFFLSCCRTDDYWTEFSNLK